MKLKIFSCTYFMHLFCLSDTNVPFFFFWQQKLTELYVLVKKRRVYLFRSNQIQKGEFNHFLFAIELLPLIGEKSTCLSFQGCSLQSIYRLCNKLVVICVGEVWSPKMRYFQPRHSGLFANTVRSRCFWKPLSTYSYLFYFVV